MIPKTSILVLSILSWTVIVQPVSSVNQAVQNIEPVDGALTIFIQEAFNGVEKDVLPNMEPFAKLALQRYLPIIKLTLRESIKEAIFLANFELPQDIKSMASLVVGLLNAAIGLIPNDPISPDTTLTWRDMSKNLVIVIEYLFQMNTNNNINTNFA